MLTSRLNYYKENFECPFYYSKFSRKKQLEKRKKAVRSYLDSVEAESSKDASDLKDESFKDDPKNDTNIKSNLDDIEKAIQKLEMSLS